MASPKRTGASVSSGRIRCTINSAGATFSTWLTRIAAIISACGFESTTAETAAFDALLNNRG